MSWAFILKDPVWGDVRKPGRKSGEKFWENWEKQKLLFLKSSRNLGFKMLYRGYFWVFLNAVFWDRQKNMSSIESIVVRYGYYRIRLGIDTFAITNSEARVRRTCKNPAAYSDVVRLLMETKVRYVRQIFVHVMTRHVRGLIIMIITDDRDTSALIFGT